jgi:hypothetical protein
MRDGGDRETERKRWSNGVNLEVLVAGAYDTQLPTPWSRGLPENVRDLHLVRKFPALYETRRFIATFTIPKQINPVHAPPPKPLLKEPSIHAWVF